MQLAWKIAIGVAAILLMIRLIQYARRVRASIKRLKVAENRIKADTAQIRQMDVKQAKRLAEAVLREKATFEAWPGAIPQYATHHRERVGAARLFATRHPGLVLCGTSYEGISFDEAVQSARMHGEALLAGRE